MTEPTATDFRHLVELTGPFGTFEHADHAVPRIEHGQCTDDVARVLIAAMREPEPSPEVVTLADVSIQFLLLAQDAGGRVLNRRSNFGTWFGEASDEDCWGRAQWAFGTAAARSGNGAGRLAMLRAFERGAMVNSPHPRANAFAVLGAGEILRVDSENPGAHLTLEKAAAILDRPVASAAWCWPEARLAYANAVLPEALLTIGYWRNNDRLMASGLRQLEWLSQMEIRDGHLSVTPTGGRGPGEPERRFDQQPIEVAALADASFAAYALTGDASWTELLKLSIGWFHGDNDLGESMRDAVTGGAYDGLTEVGPNLNEGAESTLSLITTTQHSHRLAYAI
jgi:hypothetical protein